MTRENAVATKYLREVGLNSITWEHFTGDFKSVITYLEKIANHIWETFKVDETEVFTEISSKKFLEGWDKKYLPDNLDFHTHVIMEHTGSMTAEGDYAVKVSVVDVDFLKNLEHSLHRAITQELDKRGVSK